MLKVCIGTYKAYNEGELGKWVDISDFANEQELIDWLKEEFNESNPEPMVQDMDCFSNEIVSDISSLFTLNEFLEEHPDVDQGAIEDALQIYGINGLESGLDDLIGDREAVADFIYENDLQPRVDRIENPDDQQFFQNLIDRYDVDEEVDVYAANGIISRGNNGFYFWNS